MTRRLRSAAEVLAVSVPLLAAQAVVPALLQPYSDSVLAGVAVAQEDDEKQKPKTRRTQALDNRVYEKLQAAQKAAEEKDYQKALKELDELRAKRNLNDYELANVLNLYAFVYYTQEKYQQALDAYEQIINLPEAPAGTVTQARYSAAQLYFATEQYAKGVTVLRKWFQEAENPGANAYMLMAQGLYQMKDFDGALENTEKAISLYKEKGKVPKESWYSLQRFLYYEKENYRKVVQILEEMLKHYPKKPYWLQLSAMHGELKNDMLRLAAMETAYVQGLLSEEKELINLAYLFLANEVPYKAAKVLDKGIDAGIIEPTSKNLKLLGDSWRSAQEVKRAIPVIAKAAAKSDDGDLYARLCNIYLDNDEFKKAVDACESALAKGGVKRPGNAYLVKGMAHFNLEQYAAARKAFNKAADYERTKAHADQWMNFMDRELERQRSLRES